MIKLTDEGKKAIDIFIDNLVAKRKEILDAGLDTCDSTLLPEVEDIIDDIRDFANDEEYWNCWGVTDHYSSDTPLYLKQGVHYTVKEVNEC